jgi:L-asparaginase/archaeal Glu-tRNAGln amidotransferase subunit D
MTQTVSHHSDASLSDLDCAIGLVLTGGTIGAEEDDSVLSVGDDPTRAEATLLASVWPGPGRPNIAVESPVRQLSENLEPQHWVLMAEAVRKLVDTKHVTSVLILHGTDTMAYTAAALSFLLADVDKPVILTGSLVPSGQPDSDAARNVRTALVASQELGRGVYVAFTGNPQLPGVIHLGTRVRKLRASYDAFESINRDIVGVVDNDAFEGRLLHDAGGARHQYKLAINEDVLALRLYPGLNFDRAFEIIERGGIRGVVIELYASATGPDDTDDRFSLTRFIRRCAERKVLVGTTVVEMPWTNGQTYETTLAIQAAGGVFLHDMLPETATVKMMWSLAQSDDLEAVRDLMLRPIAGEISEH